ncbi:MAG: hypothetical protein GY716_23455 [bacterium]|nr:hypothetical protein [bacterium]
MKLRFLVVSLLLLASLLVASTVDAQLQHPGNYTLAERDDSGTWNGTWVYVNRDGRWVFWIREKGKRPEIKLRYLGRSNLEGFETDWNTAADYTFRAAPVTFALSDIKADANTIEGSWDWNLVVGISSRKEHADISMYRTFRGRMAVVHFRNYEKVVNNRGKIETHTPEHAWTLRKVSNRIVSWEEILF